MKYIAYDALHKSVQPAYQMTRWSQQILNHRLNPWSYFPGTRILNAGLELTARSLQRYDKVGFNITEANIGKKSVAITEEVVLDQTFCELRHFSKPKSKKKQPKMLIMAPVSGHHATLLKPTVEGMLPSHDVYITDWKDARDIPLSEGSFGIDGYIDHIIEALELLGPDVHLFAVCQPSVQALMVASILAERNSPVRPASVTIMAGPIDVESNPTAVNKYASRYTAEWFERNVVAEVPKSYAGAGRKVYPGFMQLTGFIALNPNLHATKHLSFFNDLVYCNHEQADSHREFYDEYLAVMDMDAEFYLETVEKVFINNDLTKGNMTYAGKRVDLSAIKDTALLTIEGENDDICGAGQTEAAHRLCANIPDQMRHHHIQEEVGHYGVFSGSRFRDSIVPLVETFVAKHNSANSKTH